MTLARIILGLLSLAPMTGYDIKRHIETTVTHFWTADKAQIYRALDALVRDGLATVHTVPGQSGPARQEHRITEAGRAVLAEWLISDLERSAERDPFLARLFFAGDLGDDELGALLARRRAAVEEALATFERMREELPEPTSRAERVRLWTLENGLAHVRAEAAWLDRIEGDRIEGDRA
jgi:DNA-binding PadR family transcriptional regulator